MEAKEIEKKFQQERKKTILMMIAIGLMVYVLISLKLSAMNRKIEDIDWDLLGKRDK